MYVQQLGFQRQRAGYCYGRYTDAGGVFIEVSLRLCGVLSVAHARVCVCVRARLAFTTGHLRASAGERTDSLQDTR